jgi:oxaloacetate decarboxylase gamma subunit
MTIAVMLGQSGKLTLLGMGMVFGFLIVMIIVITLVGKLIHALHWDSDIASPPLARSSGGGGNAAAVTAAISAAVNEYRKS